MMIEQLVDEEGKIQTKISIKGSLSREKILEIESAFIEGRIEKVEKIYKRLPDEIKINQETKGLSLIKIGKNYYSIGLSYMTRRRYLAIAFFEKINPEDYKYEAIENLYNLIEDTNLSLGDKKIIKDIAVDVFYQRINFALEGHREIQYLCDCTQTQWSDSSIYNLEKYGFNVKRNIIDGEKTIKIINFKK